MQFAILLALAVAPSGGAERCAPCHPRETAGYAQTAMARSMKPAGAMPEGQLEHAASHTQFTIRNGLSGGPRQTLQRDAVTQSFVLAYEIGSGSHALGAVVEAGEHLFQSPLSYYTKSEKWDVAPGYEASAAPDFSRPVTAECLFCHADRPRFKAETLNTYLTPPFAGAGISCDRCHGPAEAHLKKPVPGSILNPAKLGPAARDSICEQCHLTGEVRIPNPGKAITEFRPGRALEDSYTVYVARQDDAGTVKVVSQAEQLALSRCARNSNGALWCGTCHNPHETPAQPAAYYRAKCLACHGVTLAQFHPTETGDCVACHMPRRPAKDGGHTAFTDHRITRHKEPEGGDRESGQLAAWREPDPALRERNLALALATIGVQNRDSNQVIQSFRMLNRLERRYPTDAATLTALGSILLTARQPAEAAQRFERALAQRPDFAPYEVNFAAALLAGGKLPEATLHLERAVQLDPLLQQAVELLCEAYTRQGEPARAEELRKQYRSAMHYRPVQ